MATVTIIRDALTGGITLDCLCAINAALKEKNIQFVGTKKDRARVCGSRNKFATVWSQKDAAGVDYAWETVAHVINTGGTFRA